MSDFSLKYLKYKKKYLKELKNQVGGANTDIERFYNQLKNIFLEKFDPKIQDSSYKDDNMITLLSRDKKIKQLDTSVQGKPHLSNSGDKYNYFSPELDIQSIRNLIYYFRQIIISQHQEFEYSKIILYFIKLIKQDYFNVDRLIKILDINNETDEERLEILRKNAIRICDLLTKFYTDIIGKRDILVEYIKYHCDLLSSQSKPSITDYNLERPKDPSDVTDHDLKLHNDPSDVTDHDPKLHKDLSDVWISEEEKTQFVILISHVKELKKLYNSIALITNKMFSLPLRPELDVYIGEIWARISNIGHLILGNNDIFLKKIFCSVIINYLTTIRHNAILLQSKDLTIYKQCNDLGEKCIDVVKKFMYIFCLDIQEIEPEKKPEIEPEKEKKGFLRRLGMR